MERISLPDSINQCRRRYLTSVKCYPKRTQLHTRAQCTYVKAEGVFSIVDHVLFLFEALILVFFLLLCCVFTHSSRGCQPAAPFHVQYVEYSCLAP